MQFTIFMIVIPDLTSVNPFFDKGNKSKQTKPGRAIGIRLPFCICVFWEEICIEETWSGDKGTRTPDLVSAIDALSQLSYIPLWRQGDSNP